MEPEVLLRREERRGLELGKTGRTEDKSLPMETPVFSSVLRVTCEDYGGSEGGVSFVRHSVSLGG